MGKSIQTLFDVRRNAGILRRYAGPYRAQLVLLTAALLCSTGLAVLSPQLLGVFIDWTRSGASLGQLAQIAGVFLGVTVLAGLLFIGSEYLSARILAGYQCHAVGPGCALPEPGFVLLRRSSGWRDDRPDRWRHRTPFCLFLRPFHHHSAFAVLRLAGRRDHFLVGGPA
jgi:hypothetical protein